MGTNTDELPFLMIFQNERDHFGSVSRLDRQGADATESHPIEFEGLRLGYARVRETGWGRLQRR